MRSKMKRMFCMLLAIAIMVSMLIVPAMASDGHVHEWEMSFWYVTETHHWRSCGGLGACDAMEKSERYGYGEHHFTADNGTRCEDCNVRITDKLYSSGICETHLWDNSIGWQMSETHHWHACMYCEERLIYREHTYTNETDGSCNGCGYIRYEGVEHEHVWSEYWSAKDGYHYRLCTQANCSIYSYEELYGYGIHTFSDGRDRICDICDMNTRGQFFDGSLEEVPYTVVVKTAEGGNAVADVPGAMPGNTVTVTVGTEEGYELEAVSAVAYDGSAMELAKASEGVYKFVMPDMAVTVTASFVQEKPVEYITQVVSGENGEVRVDGHQGSANMAALAGDAISVWCTPNEGYRLNSVTVRGADGSVIPAEKKADGSYTFVMPAQNVEISVSFVKEIQYPDVPATAWFNEAVSTATEMGLLNGYGDGNFGPSDTVTRAMTVTVLARLAGVDTSAGSTWYEAGAKWAEENSISDGTNLNGEIPREQIVTMIWRMMGKPAAENSEMINGFADCGQVSSWASDAMNWAVEVGLIKGVGNNCLNPLGTLTRAELATLLVRISAMTD